MPSSHPPTSRLGRLWTILRWPVALFILAWLTWRNADEIRKIADRGFDWWFAGVTFVVLTASMVLTFLRWYLLVWAQEIPFRIADALRLSFIGLVFNYFAPGLVGGDLIKATLIAREQTTRRAVAAATVLLDRVLGLMALFMVGALMSLLPTGLEPHPVLQTVTSLFWLGTLGSVMGLAVMMHPATPRSRWLSGLVRLPWVGPAFGEILNGIILYQSRSRVLLAAILISLVGHFGVLSSFYFSGRALKLNEAMPHYKTQLMVIPAAEVFATLVPVPGGVGVLEGAVAGFFEVAAAAQPIPRGESFERLPPAWRPALLDLTRDDAELQKTLEESGAEITPSEARAMLQDVAGGTEEAALAFFRGEREPASASFALRMYRAGYQQQANAAGLLAALGFRVVQTIITGLGAFYCLTSRREISAVLHDVEETPVAEDAPPA